MSKPFVIAVDFDGTIVKHAYPEVGESVGGFSWLRRWQELGAKLILYTMRTGGELRAAVLTCADQGVEFWAVNDNPDQDNWSVSRKVYAHLYVDDAALGVPLIHPPNERPYVDWNLVGPVVIAILEARNADV